MNNYTHALRRFWWVVVIGLVAAVAAAYKVVTNNEVFYESSTRLLVTSNEDPYLRRAIRRVVEVPASDASPPTTFSYLVEPDVQTLVRAANLYPLLVESDEVAQVRRDLFGDLPGTVSAQAIGSTVTLNRFEPGDFPVIEIVGIASRPGQAVELTRATADAFEAWITKTQEGSGVGEDDRVLIQELQVPTSATSIGEVSRVIPAVVGVAIAIAFGVLAILLDRLAPGKRVEPGRPKRRSGGRTPDDHPAEEGMAS